MLSINPQPVNSRTIAPSSESSDHSGHEEYYPDGNGQSHGKDEQQKQLHPSFSGGTIPVESWQNYAKLAGIMDAISDVQTKEKFTSMAKEALTRLKNCGLESENVEYSALSSRFMSLIGHVNAHDEISHTSNSLDASADPSELSNVLNGVKEEMDWNRTYKLLDEKQEQLAFEKRQLQSQAEDARKNIEFNNKTDDFCQAMADSLRFEQIPLAELMVAPKLAVEAQALQLPRRAAQLINN